jgi:hypothetical protein
MGMRHCPPFESRPLKEEFMSDEPRIITSTSQLSWSESTTILLTKSSVRSGLLFVTLVLLTIAIENAVALPYVIQAFLTDLGPNSLAYSMVAAVIVAICFAGVLSVFPAARRSVHDDVHSIGMLVFSTVGWITMIWGGYEGVTTPVVPVSPYAAGFVIAATAAFCFAEAFTSADKIGFRFQAAAKNSVFYAGVAGWMLVLVFALFGSFLAEVIVSDFEDKGLAQVRVPTESEMRHLRDCRVSDSHLVLCLLPFEDGENP